MGNPTNNDALKKQRDELRNQLYESSQKVLQENKNEFLAKATTFNPSMYDKKLEKLQSYGSKYQKYGYNPNRNNEQFYDDITSTGEQWKRSAVGAAKLAAIGFNDSVLFGAFANGKSNANDFGKIADIYSTQRGGVTGFTQNLLLNSGYTVGIMADMVLEEAALAAVTAVTGGLAGGATIPAMFGKGVKGLSQIANAFDKMNDLKKTINAVDKTKDLSRMAKFGNKVGNFVNPLEHTTKYIKALKNVKSVKELSTLGKLGQLGGAVFRDVKAAQLVHSESKLESNMLEKDMMDEFIKENPYATEQDMKVAAQHIQDAKALTYAENMGVIFLTNKLVFNNMYKRFDNLKGVGSFLKTGNVGKLVGTETGATVIRSGNIFQKGFYQGIKDSSKLIFEKGTVSGLKNIGKGAVGKFGTYGVSNFSEGVQETLQEIIQAKNKLKGSEAAGGYFDNLSKGLHEQWSPQGAEIFLSGFLMGGLIHPITSTVVKPIQFFQNKDYKQFTNRTQFKTERERKLKQLEEDASLINEAYKNVGDVYKSMGNNLAVQSRLEDEMIDAAANGDRKTFQDKKDESYRNHLDTMMKHGLMDEFISHVKGFKDMEMDQAKVAFGITDNYTKEQLNSFIDEKVKQAEKFKTKYERFKADYRSPINISKLKMDDPNYMDKITYHHMWNKAVDDMIFDTAEFEQNLDRKQQLLSKVKNDVESKGLPYHLYNVLTTDENIQTELKNLENDLKSLNQYESVTPEIKQEIKEKTKRKDALIRYQESVGERKRVIAEIKRLTDKANLSESESKQLDKLYNHLDQAEFRMKNRHGEYMRAIHTEKSGGKLSYDHLNETSFEALRDYYDLTDRNDEITKSIDLLSNPAYLDEYVKAHTKFADAIIKNHKEFVKKSIAKFRDKADTDTAVKELLEMGVSFDLTELDALLDEGIMPKRFYNIETEEELKKSDPLYRKAQDRLNELFDNLIEQPILEKDSDVYSEMGRGYRVSPEEKRSYSDLAKQYGFDKSNVRPTKEILQTIIDSKEATKAEKELAGILIKLVSDDSKISFVDNLSRPNIIENGESVIDARYASNNFTNSFFSIEESILKNELQRLTEKELESDEAFANKINSLREQVINYLKEKSKTNDKLRTNYKGLENNLEFIKEAFANESFQYLLTEIKTDQSSKTNWFKFIEAITSIFHKAIDVVSNSVFNEVVATVQQKIKFENLSQPTPKPKTETKTETKEEQQEEEVQDLPVEESPQYFDPESDVKTFPKELLSELISDYKKAVKIGDADGVGMDKLSVDNLTPSFINWVNDSAQDTVEKFANKYNATIQDDDVISEEQYEELLSLGYDDEDVALFTVPEIENILENEIKKDPAKQNDENVIIDEIIDENVNIEQDDTSSKKEEPVDTTGEGESSTTGSTETQTEKESDETKTIEDRAIIADIITAQLELGVDLPKILETLAEQGYVEKINGSAFFRQSVNRDAIVFNIGGAIVPVYRSSQGTSSKTKGEWYPFFFNGGDWLVKAGADSYKDGYNNPIIKQILDTLNKNYKYDKPIATAEGNNEELLALLPLNGLDIDVSYEENSGKYDFQNYVAIALILKDWQSKLGTIDVTGYQTYLDGASSSLIKANPALKSEIEKAFKIPSDIFAEILNNEKTQKKQNVKSKNKTEPETVDSSTLKTNREKHDYLVSILSKPNGVVRGKLLQKEGSTSVTALVLSDMKITFYDHEGVVTPEYKGAPIKLILVPSLTLEDGRTFTNVIEVYSDGKLLGVVAQNDYVGGKQTINENTTDEELESIAEQIVDENEILFSKEAIASELDKLGFNLQDVKKLSKAEKMRIVKEQISKDDYVKQKKQESEAKKNEKKIKLQEDISKFLENKFDNVQTEDELTTLFGEVVKQFKNYKSELPFIQKLFNDARVMLANQKDFAKLKAGDKLLLNDGRIVKVKSIAKNSIEVVDFNSIIENKTNISKNNFDNTVNKVINDFNKSEQEIASNLDNKNIEELSTIMSKFTAQTLSMKDAEVSDNDMLEHFKNCK